MWFLYVKILKLIAKKQNILYSLLAINESCNKLMILSITTTGKEKPTVIFKMILC